MLSTLAFGAIGFADDYIKVVKKRSMGLTAWQKLGLQFAASAAVAVALLQLEGAELLDAADGALREEVPAGPGVGLDGAHSRTCTGWRSCRLCSS